MKHIRSFVSVTPLWTSLHSGVSCSFRFRFRSSCRPTTRFPSPLATLKQSAVLRDMDERVVSPVEHANGGRVTASDVAVSSGLSVSMASAELARLAWLIGGAIEVSLAGDLVYRIDSPRSRLQMASFRALVYMTYGHAARILDSCERFTFRYTFAISAFLSLSLFKYKTKESDFRLFSETVLSVVFGDGNPNVGMIHNQWKALAVVIDSNQGSVIAEQFRPFIVDARDAAADERDMLPILLRFGGRPEVTDRGDIIYVFDKFKSTARNTDGGADRLAVAYLNEIPMQFSKANKDECFVVGLLAVLNMGVVMLMGLLLDVTPAVYDAVWYSFPGFVRFVYPMLLLHTLICVLLPVIRILWVSWCNRGIRYRNSIRVRSAMLLSEPDTSLLRKLKSARTYRIDKRFVDAANVVYSSNMEADEVARRHDEQILKVFDERIGKVS